MLKYLAVFALGMYAAPKVKKKAKKARKKLRHKIGV